MADTRMLIAKLARARAQPNDELIDEVEGLAAKLQEMHNFYLEKLQE